MGNCTYNDGFCAFASWNPKTKRYDCGPYGIPEGINCKGKQEKDLRRDLAEFKKSLGDL